MDIEILERVQRRFTRFLPHLRHLPYNCRLKLFNLSSIYVRRLIFDLTFVFKIIKGLININFESFFSFTNNCRTRGYSFKINTVQSRLDIRHHFLAPQLSLSGTSYHRLVFRPLQSASFVECWRSISQIPLRCNVFFTSFMITSLIFHLSSLFAFLS